MDLSQVIGLALVGTILCSCGSTSLEGSPATSVAGTAEKQGVLFLKDASTPTREVATAIRPDGGFMIDTTGMKAPFMLKAVFSNGSSQYALANTNGHINVNALSTNLVKLAVLGLDLTELYLALRADMLIIIVATLESLENRIIKR